MAPVDTDWLLALSSMVLSFTVVGVIVHLYIRLGRLETVLKAGRERSKERYKESLERSDTQYRELRSGRMPNSEKHGNAPMSMRGDFDGNPAAD